MSHMHLNEGGQAVVANHFHQHTGDRENGKSVKQSHATGSDSIRPTLLSADPFGIGAPIPSHAGPEAVP